MKEKIKEIFKRLAGLDKESKSLSGINIPGQFIQEEASDPSIARNLNSAFLILLSGASHPLYTQALQYIGKFDGHPLWAKCVKFYKDGLDLIGSEMSEAYDSDDSFRDELDLLYSFVTEPEKNKGTEDKVEMFHRLFFPEGVSISENRIEKTDLLRQKRSVKISNFNPSPVRNPARELLFTSNILITVPSSAKIDNLPVSDSLKELLKQMEREEQAYWYDHPIPIGVPPEHNEVLHGLEGLDDTIEFEKARGTLGKDGKITCILSVSATHKGLHGLAKEYLGDELKKEKNIRNLNAVVFTEADTNLLLDEIFIPAAERYGINGTDLLYEIVGVDGEYGRHYSFLKAIAAFWQVFIDAGIKGTFKIDLDQVFPQRELVEQTGASAFEHLRTPLWGAKGTDYQGNNIELGMIAGALVNREDIEGSLFTPDVPFPSEEIEGDNLIFFSTLPQALSTEAEMMTRYNEGLLDGKTRCIQRIHVTGGTNGILIDSLRRHRPFTPTFIGRAEDQAYILSILLQSPGQNLRYVHKDGLIMRHDKDAFAGDAIKTAAIGKLIGDYIRILLFSYYCRALPWSFEDIKETIDPFTGCFASKIPLTVVYLRFALKTASFFNEKKSGKDLKGHEFMSAGCRRLHDTIEKLNRGPNPLIEQYRKEKEGWDVFYDILDIVEKKINDDDPFALGLREKALSIMEERRIVF
jgi:hypothetical protein